MQYITSDISNEDPRRRYTFTDYWTIKYCRASNSPDIAPK